MSDPIRAELEAQLAPYRRWRPDVRWTRPETWHLTLLFLGSVHPSRVPSLELLVDDLAARFEPYRALADQPGGRSRSGEGVAWLGLSTGAGSLIEVATLAAALSPPDITDSRRPKRTPSAHLTLARKADEPVVDALRSETHGRLGVTWTVAAIELVRSHLGPGGARYETLHMAAL